ARAAAVVQRRVCRVPEERHAPHAEPWLPRAVAGESRPRDLETFRLKAETTGSDFGILEFPPSGGRVLEVTLQQPTRQPGAGRSRRAPIPRRPPRHRRECPVRSENPLPDTAGSAAGRRP